MEYREKMGNGGYAGKSFNGGKVPVCTAALVCLNAGIFVAGLIAPELGRWMEAKGCFSAVYLLYEKGGALQAGHCGVFACRHRASAQ